MGQILKLVQHTLFKNVFILFCIIANSAAPGPYFRVKGKTELWRIQPGTTPFFPGCCWLLATLTQSLSLFLFLPLSFSLSVYLFVYLCFCLPECVFPIVSRFFSNFPQPTEKIILSKYPDLIFYSLHQGILFCALSRWEAP